MVGWVEGRVIELEYDNSEQKNIKKVKVHYFNYHPKYDRWIDYNNSNEMAMIGSRSKAYGIGKSRLKKKSEGLTLTELAKSISCSMKKF